MKKTISIILCIFPLFVLCSCSEIGDSNLSYSGEVRLPSDGIIAEDTLLELKNNSEVRTYYCDTDEYSYNWVIFGSSIKEVKDINLKAEIKEENDVITITFKSENTLSYIPLFSFKTKNTELKDGYILSFNSDIVTQKINAKGKANDKTISFTPVSLNCVATLSVSEKEESDDEYITSENFSSGQDSTLKEVEVPQSTSVKETTTDSDNQTTKKHEESTTIKYQTTKDEITTKKSESTTVKETTVPETTQKKTLSCTISVECSTILSNLGDIESSKLSSVPSDGVIMYNTTVEIEDGESVFSVLRKACNSKGIRFEYSGTETNAYIEGIHNLYEFDCGQNSGWMYRVNGVYPNVGCGEFSVHDGDIIEWKYTCDLGHDIGGYF